MSLAFGHHITSAAPSLNPDGTPKTDAIPSAYPMPIEITKLTPETLAWPSASPWKTVPSEIPETLA